jgi:hypothetical protein
MVSACFTVVQYQRRRVLSNGLLAVASVTASWHGHWEAPLPALLLEATAGPACKLHCGGRPCVAPF